MGSSVSVEERFKRQVNALRHAQRLLKREIAAQDAAQCAARIHAENAVHAGNKRAAYSYAREAVAKGREWERLRDLDAYIAQFMAALVRQQSNVAVNSVLAETTSILRDVSQRMPMELFGEVVQRYNLESDRLGFQHETMQETLEATAPDPDADADADDGAAEDEADAVTQLLGQLTDEHDLRVYGRRVQETDGADQRRLPQHPPRKARKKNHDDVDH